MSIFGIIPARYGSTRFPGKPLALIAGKTMIQRVYERASKAGTLSQVIVATDDARIFKHVTDFGGQVVMTSPDHTNGTERCAEVLTLLEEVPDFVINIQGDEPLIAPAQIDTLGQLLNNQQPRIATLIQPLQDLKEVNNPNVVKAVTDESGKALYFSRYGIPYHREVGSPTPRYFKHIGIYGFAVNTLREVVTWPESSLEHAERLEQLRWLEHGEAVVTAISEHPCYAVDVPDDITLIERLLASYGEA